MFMLIICSYDILDFVVKPNLQNPLTRMKKTRFIQEHFPFPGQYASNASNPT